MDHKHEWETVGHPTVSHEAAELGIKGVELRQCKTCGRNVPYIRARAGWFSLFAEVESSEQDILLA